MKKSLKIIIPITVFGIATLIAFYQLSKINSEAKLITPDVTIKQARDLSAGNKSACLDDDKFAVAAVRENDTFTYDDEGEEEYSRFDTILASGIIDVPAGTIFERTVSNFDDTDAKGTIYYEDNYGNYNYVMTKSDDWQLISLVACE